MTIRKGKERENFVQHREDMKNIKEKEGTQSSSRADTVVL